MSALTPLGADWDPLVSKAGEALGVTVAPEALARIRSWLDAIASWNARIDLTAARTNEELVDLMVADALVIAAKTPEGLRLVDVGTGAGAPGLGLGLLRPDLDVTLVEPLQKRVSFLRTVIGGLGLSHVRVLRDRGEAVADRGERFDVAVARATLAPPAWLALGARLAKEGGSVWVLLAKEAPPILEGWEVVESLSYQWPFTEVERHAVLYGRG